MSPFYRLLCALTRNDALWEHVCFHHLSPLLDGVRTVVVALGGYCRLYTICIKPVVSPLGKMRVGAATAQLETQHEVELSLSLFCVDYYERGFLGREGGRLGGEALSLVFLYETVSV